MSGPDYIMAIIGIFIYCIPALLAKDRKHHNTMAIAALNLLTGWTGIGWVAALIWAMTATQRK